MGRLPGLPLTIFERTGVAAHQSLAHDHLTYCDLATDRQQLAYEPSASAIPSHFLACNTESRLSPTYCARFPNSPLVAGRGYTIRLPPSAKARRRTQTQRSSRPSSRSTGRAPTKSSQLAPVPPLTPRTAALSALSS